MRHEKARLHKIRQRSDKTSQENRRQYAEYKARQSNNRHDKTREDITQQDKTIHGNSTRYDKIHHTLRHDKIAKTSRYNKKNKTWQHNTINIKKQGQTI